MYFVPVSRSLFAFIATVLITPLFQYSFISYWRTMHRHFGHHRTGLPLPDDRPVGQRKRRDQRHPRSLPSLRRLPACLRKTLT